MILSERVKIWGTKIIEIVFAILWICTIIYLLIDLMGERI